MIIGREKERKIFDRMLASKESEFITIYGRRRVGKTFLVRETFVTKKCHFVHVTGKYKRGMREQLAKFSEGLSEAFYDKAPMLPPKNWEEAFQRLHINIEKSKQKVVVFLDELPWLASPRSGLLSVIDYYWNRHWQQRNNVILIVCGSSASWIIKKIINDKGGLHGRTTCKIKLEPFSLYESKEYLKSRKIRLNNKSITNLYMILGGIPYYLKHIQPGLTAEQNIQELLFSKNAALKDEFYLLFKSLFKNSEAYIELIKLISTKRHGLLRTEIKEGAKLSSLGGHLSERLEDLRMAGFIEEHVSWKRKHGEYYKLVDEFCLFFLFWMDKHKKNTFLEGYWVSQCDKPSYKAWSGYAFEAVVMKHIDQVVSALGIKSGGIASSWKYIPAKKSKENNGAQVDLLLSRNDHAITLCEIKYNQASFKIDKAYAKILINKIDVFRRQTKTQREVFLSLILANGLQESMYSEELVDSVVTLDDLFKERS